MTTKAEFFERLDNFPASRRGLEPKGLRLEKATNFGLDIPAWNIWIVGPGSIDQSLLLGVDIQHVKKYKSLQKAEKDLLKYEKWFKEWLDEKP